jgi:oligoendopeptidase F
MAKVKSNNNNKIKSFKWDLKDVIPKGEFERLYSSAENDIKKFTLIRKRIKPNMSSAEFKKIIIFTEKFKEKLGRLGSYTSLLLAGNIKDSNARFYQSKVDMLSIKIVDSTLYLSQWIKGLNVKGLKLLDDKNAKRLFASVPDLKYGLFKTRKAAKHSLSEKEEKIIHRKDTTGCSVISELYDMIVNDFKYTLKLPAKNKKGYKEVIIDNQQKVTSYAHNVNKKERKAAYQALFVPYKNNIDKFFAIYSALVRDWKNEADLRKYEKSISVRNFANSIPDKAVDVLLETCTKNRTLFHRYFKLKAKMLGLKKLERYDVYAPVTKSKEKFTFDQAKSLVFDTFEEFSPDFAAKAKSILEKNHLDSHPRKNKRNGAFCMSIVPSVTPYVLTNFDGTFRDVSTIAHELGHAVHDLYASNHYYSVTHAPLPLCETASTFSEMILFEKLLSKAKPKQRVAMLMDKLADSYATILRQNYFIKFEIVAHEMLSSGTTHQELSNKYLSLLKEQFGDSVKINSEFEHEWAYIPHIYHSPFYCYAYNFGELLSLALFARYKKEGKAFVPKFEKILSAGGSVDPVKLLQSINVDITSPKFWQEGFSIIKDWVEMLEKEI